MGKGIMKEKAYGQFAKFYDIFMRDIPYGEWAEYVTDRLSFYGCSPQNKRNNMLELGCGTGNLSRYFCMEGYEVTGLDLSDKMIKEAQKKIIPSFYPVTYDMRVPFGTPGSYDCVVSLCDSMNYLLCKSDLALTFKAVYSELTKGGIFIFDLKHREFFLSLGDDSFSDTGDGVTYIWKNHFDEKRNMNFYDITFYRRIVGHLYRSFKENHIQRAYEDDFIRKLAAKSGFVVLECERRGERDYYILKKKEN